ncbi:MAG: LacI family DNA-binding transcriptional regulator [Fusobacteriaceae bacterium]
MIKIEDIAKEAGVSKGTVSKVINDYPNISEKLRKKVNDIIKKNNFVPNNSARNLAGKKNRVVGLFVYDEGELNNSYFFQSFVGMTVDECEKKGFSVLVSILRNNSMIEKIKNFYDSKTIDGAIIIGMKSNIKEIDTLIDNGYKIALIDYADTCSNSNTILINSNNFYGAQMATEHLINKGSKTLLHISGSLEKFAGKERALGFETICKEKNINYEILEGDFNGNHAKTILKKHLEKTQRVSDGIFCANDETAIAIMEYCEEIGIKPGKFFKIIGFDNIQLSSYVNPKLTTIDVNLRDMAIKSVDYLIEKIENPENVEKYIYETKIQLIKRES